MHYGIVSSRLSRSPLPGWAVLSILEAVFIVSPKMENLGSFVPISPVTTGPVWIPTRTMVGSSL